MRELNIQEIEKKLKMELAKQDCNTKTYGDFYALLDALCSEILDNDKKPLDELIQEFVKVTKEEYPEYLD